MSQIGADTLTRRSESTHRGSDFEIDLSTVRLRGDRVRRGEPGLFRDELVELFDFVVVPVEDLKEAGLRSRRALDTAEAQLVAHSLHGAEIHHQVLDPDACSLAHRRQLCGLEMGVAETWQVLPFSGKIAEPVNGCGGFSNDDV